MTHKRRIMTHKPHNMNHEPQNFSCKPISTKNATLFMQNKPNLLNPKTTVTSVLTKAYRNIRPYSRAQNKPNQTQLNPISNPIKPNLPKHQNKRNLRPNKGLRQSAALRSNPKQTQSNPISNLLFASLTPWRTYEFLTHSFWHCHPLCNPENLLIGSYPFSYLVDTALEKRVHTLFLCLGINFV